MTKSNTSSTCGDEESQAGAMLTKGGIMFVDPVPCTFSFETASTAASGQGSVYEDCNSEISLENGKKNQETCDTAVIDQSPDDRSEEQNTDLWSRIYNAEKSLSEIGGSRGVAAQKNKPDSPSSGVGSATTNKPDTKEQPWFLRDGQKELPYNFRTHISQSIELAKRHRMFYFETAKVVFLIFIACVGMVGLFLLGGQLTTRAPSYWSIESIAASISGVSALSDQTSPAYLALTWMTENDDLSNRTNAITDKSQRRERYSLAVTYFSVTTRKRQFALAPPEEKRTQTNEARKRKSVFTGHGNTRSLTDAESIRAPFPIRTLYNSKWLSGMHHCQWEGITCDYKFCVTKIDLPGIGLFGHLPEGKELSQFPCLESLNLGENKLRGTLPDSIYEIENLASLHLQNNHLSGTISTNIKNMRNIQSIYLGDNAFTGSIPSAIKDVPHLHSLSFLRNHLNGTIPVLPKTIEYLDFGSNHMTGTLPQTLMDLNQLSMLYLDHNKFQGTIPPTFGGLGKNKLQEFWVNHNHLVGYAPTSFSETWALTIKTQGNNITILHDICWKQVMAGRGNILEIGADCGKCSCDVLCDPDRCY